MRSWVHLPVDDYLRQVVADLRAGRLDSLLVYKKGLRKSLDAYTATTPPHVAAARKMASRPGRVIAYVVTTDGPEPAGEVAKAHRGAPCAALASAADWAATTSR